MGRRSRTDKCITRCAVHFKSHKVRDGDRSLYQTLLATDVYRSDGFSKTLTLHQGGGRITVESGKANLHIKEDGKNLTLFVPRDSTARERCYLSQLPNQLLGYLAISDTAAKSTLTAVLTGSQSVLDDLLEDYGIIEVPDLVPLQSTTQYEEREIAHRDGDRSRRLQRQAQTRLPEDLRHLRTGHPFRHIQSLQYHLQVDLRVRRTRIQLREYLVATKNIACFLIASSPQRAMQASHLLPCLTAMGDWCLLPPAQARIANVQPSPMQSLAIAHRIK
jgi:hypothetical protein